jgi:hypothetical protein
MSTRPNDFMSEIEQSFQRMEMNFLKKQPVPLNLPTSRLIHCVGQDEVIERVNRYVRG